MMKVDSKISIFTIKELPINLVKCEKYVQMLNNFVQMNYKNIYTLRKYYKIVQSENCKKAVTFTITFKIFGPSQISNLKHFLCTLAALQRRYLFKVCSSLSLPILNISRPQSASHSLRGRQACAARPSARRQRCSKEDFMINLSRLS